MEPSSLCALYLLNSASFYFAWLGLWAIGAAPAMINVNLSGDALVHSVKISGAGTVLVDGDEKVQERFEQVKAKIEALGIRIVCLGDEKRSEIEGGAEVGMVDESLRRGVKGTDPFALFYTRYVFECKAILITKRATNQVAFQRNNRLPKSRPIAHGSPRPDCFWVVATFSRPLRSQWRQVVYLPPTLPWHWRHPEYNVPPQWRLRRRRALILGIYFLVRHPFFREHVFCLRRRAGEVFACCSGFAVG